MSIVSEGGQGRSGRSCLAHSEFVYELQDTKDCLLSAQARCLITYVRLVVLTELAARRLKRNLNKEPAIIDSIV